MALAPVSAVAEVWTICGPLVGASHLVQGGGVNNVQAGGNLGRMPGETRLTHNPDGDPFAFDVEYEENGKLRFVSDEAADIMTMEVDGDRVVLAAIYPIGLVETFHFSGDQLTYARINHDDGKSDLSTFKADCTWQR